MVLPRYGGKKRLSCRTLGAATAFALAFSVAGYAPSAAYAGDAENGWSDAVAESKSPDYAPYSSTADGARTYSAPVFPEKFDLRDRGVVTPVKFQSPWGTCWGFAAVAASETSILSEMGTTYDEFPLDLSERQLAYFAYAAAPGYAGSQEGEGAWVTQGTASAENPNVFFNRGGSKNYATTMFSAGIGPLYEDMIPYRNEEGIIVCTVRNAEGESGREYLTEGQIEEKRAEGLTVKPLYYADTYPDPDNEGKTLHATWGVDELYWLASSYELEESSILPDMWIRDEAGNTVSINQESMEAVKSELFEGRAVAMSYLADTSRPNEQGEGLYFNENTWSHYTHEEGTGTNHAVAIVGWDDAYSRDNFNAGHRPPADGAWLVKNSWGAETEEFPNKSDWGVEDEQGRHTGYFWLSYYDKSISKFETFNYDLESYTEEDEYIIDQYNYLITGIPVVNAYDAPAPSANVFTAAEDMSVRTMTCETTKPNTTVTYELYLLDEDDAAPDDGELVAEEEETYEFGGFHRMTLPEEERVPVREGQRYAVVITQHCADDGRYYQSVASNLELLTKEEAEQERENCRNSMRARIVADKKKELSEKYISEGMPEEEAEALAEEEAWDYVENPEVEEYIRQEVERQYSIDIDTGFKTVVNPGESYTFMPANADSAEGAWTDWSKVVASLPTDMVYDNFPIKAFADYRDYADVATLDELQQMIDACAAELEGVAVSADGSDVAKDEMWVTQEAYDAFAAAIEAARELMAGAGESYETELSPATPGEDEAAAAIGALDSAMAAFEEAQKIGSKGDGPASPGDPDEPGDQPGLDELKQQLEQAIESALADLEALKGQASQEAYDAFKKAIDDAQGALSAENSSEADIEKAMDNLSAASEAYKASAGQKPAVPGEPAAPQFSKTSDPAGHAAAAGATAAAIAAGVVMAARKRIG